MTSSTFAKVVAAAATFLLFAPGVGAAHAGSDDPWAGADVTVDNCTEAW